MLILNSLGAALWYLEQLHDALAPRSLKSHVVTSFGTSFLGVTSVGGFDLQGTNRSMSAPAQLHHCSSIINTLSRGNKLSDGLNLHVLRLVEIALPPGLMDYLTG